MDDQSPKKKYNLVHGEETYRDETGEIDVEESTLSLSNPHLSQYNATFNTCRIRRF